MAGAHCEWRDIIGARLESQILESLFGISKWCGTTENVGEGKDPFSPLERQLVGMRSETLASGSRGISIASMQAS